MVQDQISQVNTALSWVTLYHKKKNKKPLTVVGDGKQTRDFIHVDDLVSALVKVIQSKSVNKIYNLGSGKKTSINTLAKVFNGKKKFIPNRPGEAKNSLADISKFKKDVNWYPKISLEEGIKKLIKYERQIIHNQQ